MRRPAVAGHDRREFHSTDGNFTAAAEPRAVAARGLTDCDPTASARAASAPSNSIGLPRATARTQVDQRRLWDDPDCPMGGHFSADRADGTLPIDGRYPHPGDGLLGGPLVTVGSSIAPD